MDIKRVMDYIDEKRSVVLDASDKVWEFAETAFEEHKSAEYLCKVLESEGFEVKRGIADIDTAFSATFGQGAPIIGILGEYDALSEISQVAGLHRKEALVEGANGHGCGHNLLGAGSLAAALGIKKYLEETGKSGTVIYYGCPGEEGGSGKTFMAREGVFDDLDACLTWHPGSTNNVMAATSLANCQVYYRFYGIAAHAGSAHLGRSALDAVELLNVGVQFLREHMIPQARVHYSITNTGGFSPNTVQPFAEALYLIRAPENDQVQELYKRVSNIAKGAALMTDTRLEVDFVKACSRLVPNNVLEKMLYENMKSLPLPSYTEEEREFASKFSETFEMSESALKNVAALLSEKADKDFVMSKVGSPIYDFLVPYQQNEVPFPGSTDVGDVSWICPTGQISVASWAADTPGHSWQSVSQGIGSIAHKSVIYAGKVMAATAIELLTNPDKLKEAKAELDERLSGNGYACPIPKGVKPRAISTKK